MTNLLHAGRLLLLDLASTLLFLVLFLLTHDVVLAVGLSIALAAGQFGWQVLRRKPIDSMQWLSLFLVIAAGGATLVTADPRFVLLKPSVIYAIVGVVMLRPGWMNRYLPPQANELVPDIARRFGFVWAALMFFSAALNGYVALRYSVVTWASFMAGYGIVSKVGLFFVQFATMKVIGRRRHRERQLVLAAAGARQVSDANRATDTNRATEAVASGPAPMV